MKKHLPSMLLIGALVFTSCASKNTDSSVDDYSYDDNYDEVTEIVPAKPVTDTYLGDFDPIEMGEFIFLQKSKKTVKPKQIKEVHLVPRRNTVEFYFRDTANVIVISLNKAERDKIVEACNTFLQQYEEKTIPHHKVNTKTAYFNSKTQTWFGVFGPATECSKTDYYVNCEFIDRKPYLLLHFAPTRTDNYKAFTPKLNLYMSPTQIRNFITQMDQETLNAYVSGYNEKAYTY